MSKWTKILGLSFAAAMVIVTILYAAIHPDGGAVYQSPYATLGIGLVGLGLCMESKKRHQARQETEKQQA